MSTKCALLKLVTLRRLKAPASAMAIAVICMTFAKPARPQETVAQAESIVEAARNARERMASSTRHPRLITNDDIDAQPSVSSASSSSSTNAAETPGSPVASCDNPRAQSLKMDLQDAEQQLAQLRGELSYQPEIISGRDLDLGSFQPGNSGLNVGSPASLDSQPPSAPRVAEVEVEERVASLRKALRTACEPPEAASIQVQIDDLEQRLDLLQRQFALDQEDYSARPVTENIGGSPGLDAERQQIQDLQSQIEQLRAQLAAMNVSQGSM